MSTSTFEYDSNQFLMYLFNQLYIITLSKIENFTKCVKIMRMFYAKNLDNELNSKPNSIVEIVVVET